MTAAAATHGQGPSLARRIGRAARTFWIVAVTVPLAVMPGAWLGWQHAGALPAEAEMLAIVEVLTPGDPPATIERRDHVAGLLYAVDDENPRAASFLFGADDYGAGYVEADFYVGITELEPLAKLIEAAGWRTGAVRTTELDGTAGQEFTAARGDWRMLVQSGNRNQKAMAYVERAEPPAALVLSVLFATLGAALAGCCRAGPAGASACPGAMAFLLLTFNSILAGTALVTDPMTTTGTALFPLPWEYSATVLVRPLTLAGLLLLIIWLRGCFRRPDVDHRGTFSQAGGPTVRAVRNRLV